jgi:hypothetical protein
MSIHDPVLDDRQTVVLPPPSRWDWENAAKRIVIFPFFPIFITYGVK